MNKLYNLFCVLKQGYLDQKVICKAQKHEEKNNQTKSANFVFYQAVAVLYSTRMFCISPDCSVFHQAVLFLIV